MIMGKKALKGGDALFLLGKKCVVIQISLCELWKAAAGSEWQRDGQPHRIGAALSDTLRVSDIACKPLGPTYW